MPMKRVCHMHIGLLYRIQKVILNCNDNFLPQCIIYQSLYTAITVLVIIKTFVDRVLYLEISQYVKVSKRL